MSSFRRRNSTVASACARAQVGKPLWVVPPRNPGALASALNRVLENATLRIRMGEAGYARAKSEFTLERMWEGMLAVYQSVTASRK